MLVRKQKSFEPHQASRMCFFHEAIVDTSFAVHTGLTVCLHSKHSSKSHPKVYVFSPQQSQWSGVCLSVTKHWLACSSIDSEDFCLLYLDWW